MTKSARPKAYSNAPSQSCRLWVQKDNWGREWAYVELAAGLITKFDATEGGLTKIIKLLRKECFPLKNGASKTKLPVPAKTSKRKLPEVSDEELEAAMEMLKKEGLV